MKREFSPSKFSRRKNPISVDTSIGRNQKRITLSERAKYKLYKEKLAEEKQAELEKLELRAKREALCLKLLDSFAPGLPSSIELGEKRKERKMKFTGDELLVETTEAIAMLSDNELSTVQIYQALRVEIAEMHDDEVQRKIDIAKSLEKFFRLKVVKLETEHGDRKRAATQDREFTLAAGKPKIERAAILTEAEKLDRKMVRKLSGGKEISKENKWKMEKLAADLVNSALED